MYRKSNCRKLVKILLILHILGYEGIGFLEYRGFEIVRLYRNTVNMGCGDFQSLQTCTYNIYKDTRIQDTTIQDTRIQVEMCEELQVCRVTRI